MHVNIRVVECVHFTPAGWHILGNMVSTCCQQRAAGCLLLLGLKLHVPRRSPVSKLVCLPRCKLLRHRLLDLGVGHAVKDACLNLIQYLRRSPAVHNHPNKFCDLGPRNG